MADNISREIEFISLQDLSVTLEFSCLMCSQPTWPYGTRKRSPPHFFALDDWLGICTALVVGLQHCLAMVGGLIVPPTLIM
jgi:hypothetical protein